MKDRHQAKWEKTCRRSENKSRLGFQHLFSPDKTKMLPLRVVFFFFQVILFKKLGERGRSDNTTNL